jgi:hypothetical protein
VLIAHRIALSPNKAQALYFARAAGIIAITCRFVRHVIFFTLAMYVRDEPHPR